MQRFQAIGESRLQIVEVVQHIPAHAARVRKALDDLNPGLVTLDLTPAEWDVAQGGQAVTPFEGLLVNLLARHGTTEPFAAARAAGAWAREHGAQLALLLAGPQPTAGRLDLWRLKRMLRKEGFDARDAIATVDRFHLHYVSRVAGLHAWRQARRISLARALVARHAARKLDAVCILSRPDADPVLDEVQVLLGRRSPDAAPRPPLPPPSW